MKVRLKGLHDLRTVRGLLGRSVPGSRAARISQLARLEHEKASVERELEMWEVKRRQAQRRLENIRSQIRQIQPSLREGPDRTEGASEDALRKGGRPADRRAIDLEY